MELSHAYEMLTKFRRELKALITQDLTLTVSQKMIMHNQIYRMDKWIYQAEKKLMIQFDVSQGEWEYESGY